MSVQFIDLIKSKKSHNKTQKYKIECQQRIDENYDTTRWISLKEIIKKNKDIKIFNGLINNINIIVKIGIAETIIKEYEISQLLLNIKGFIIYLCYFNCLNKINKIIENSSICANEGTQINILLMKEYKLGNIKKYQWNKDNFYILKSLITQIFISLSLAFNEYGFLHNDTHFGNFLIKENSKPEIIYTPDIAIKLYGYSVVIMDFENSLFDHSKLEALDILYIDFKKIINNIFLELYLVVNTDELCKYFDDNIKNKTIIDINKLILLVDKLDLISIRNIKQLYKYDPNDFT
jgi:hypothetical protein